MSRTAAKVTQADLARALRAAEQVGVGRLTVEVTPNGAIRNVATPTSRELGVPEQVQLEVTSCSK